jgi:hypothetical protein
MGIMQAKDMIDWDCQEMDPHIKNKLERALVDEETIEAGKVQVERPAGIYDEGGEPEGVIQDVNNFHPGYHSSSIIIVKDIGTYLNKHYNGWAWMVQVNEFGHMIEIFNQHLHPTYGYRIRMEDIMNDPSRKAIKQGAGEILERFGMARHGLCGENLTRLAEALRDGAGNCIPDISDLNDKKANTQADIARKIAKGDIRIFEVNGQKMVRIKK